MDGLANALVGAAAADISAHGVVDVGVGGRRFFGQQGNRGHDLAGLAVSTLRNIGFHPGLLHRVAGVGRKSLDGGDFFSGYAGNGRDARAGRFSLNVNGAGAAQSHTAAKLCAGHVEGVAQNPEQRHFGADIHRLRLAVQDKSDGHQHPRWQDLKADYRTRIQSRKRSVKLLGFFLNGEQLDFKNESGVGADLAARAARAVGQVGGNEELPL